MPVILPPGLYDWWLDEGMEMRTVRRTAEHAAFGGDQLQLHVHDEQCARQHEVLPRLSRVVKLRQINRRFAS